MFTYKQLDDIVLGDYAFEVHADSFPELFRGAGIATTEAMVNLSTLVVDQNVEISISSPSIELLLYDFLAELVYIKDVDLMLFKDYSLIISKDDNNFTLKGTLHGAIIDREVHELYTDVKAVTMHELKVIEKDSGWYCHAILDL